MQSKTKSDSMKSLADIVSEQQGSRAAHDDPLTDALLAELLQSLEQVCVLTDRLATVESLRCAGVEPTAEAIDEFVLDDVAIAERLASHRRYFDSVFSRLANVD